MVSSDRFFDAAFAAASASMPAYVVGTAHAGEYVFAEALRISTEILAGVLSSCPDQQRAARSRLEIYLSSGKESS